jgi:hypothetical protein
VPSRAGWEVARCKTGNRSSFFNLKLQQNKKTCPSKPEQAERKVLS